MKTYEIKQIEERFLNLASAYYNMAHRMLTLFSGSRPGKLLCSHELDRHHTNLQRELVLFLLMLYQYMQHLDKATASEFLEKVSPFEKNSIRHETVDALARYCRDKRSGIRNRYAAGYLRPENLPVTVKRNGEIFLRKERVVNIGVFDSTVYNKMPPSANLAEAVELHMQAIERLHADLRQTQQNTVTDDENNTRDFPPKRFSLLRIFRKNYQRESNNSEWLLEGTQRQSNDLMCLANAYMKAWREGILSTRTQK